MDYMRIRTKKTGEFCTVHPNTELITDIYNRAKKPFCPKCVVEDTEKEIATNRYENYREILAEADGCKDELSVLRKRHLYRMQKGDNSQMQINLLYLNVLQESQEFLSVMRHQLRASKKFMEN